MKKGLVPALVLAGLLAANAVPAAEKKDKTVIDIKSIQADNVVPNQNHATMGAFGERIHGGAFGPWRCQVKLLDRRAQIAKQKASGAASDNRTSHFLSLSIMDPATGKGLTKGEGTLFVTGPDRKKATVKMQQASGPFLADVDMEKPGEYEFRIAFASGKQKASTKFSYTVK
ncbi:MAG TPA: hypothetical protein VIU29_08650 [Candidatus Deferrimicrobiaceae bacterium]